MYRAFIQGPRVITPDEALQKKLELQFWTSHFYNFLWSSILILLEASDLLGLSLLGKLTGNATCPAGKS